MMIRGTETKINETLIDVTVPTAWRALKRAILEKAGLKANWRLNEEQKCFEGDVSDPLDDHERWVTCSDATDEQVWAFKYVYGLETHFKLTDTAEWGGK